MIDYARISVKAGDGGQGSGSLMKIRGKRFAKADGGDGGRGGNVYFEASNSLNTLEQFRYLKNYQAKNGQRGLSRKRKGADGQDLVIKVPVGTEVKVISEKGKVNSQLNTNHYSLITDLVAEGDKILVGWGGRGGRGNIHLRDDFERRPKRGEGGTGGELLDLVL